MNLYDVSPYVPKVPLIGPAPPTWFAEQADGCTCSPDGIWLIGEWRDACIFHDYHYCKNAPYVSRGNADIWLCKNLIRCGCPRTIALRYYVGVRLGGWRCYRKHEVYPPSDD